jgi:hypothetical protein
MPDRPLKLVSTKVALGAVVILHLASCNGSMEQVDLCSPVDGASESNSVSILHFLGPMYRQYLADGAQKDPAKRADGCSH